MKTNQILVRKMGALKVEQRTADGYFNATSLLRQWNELKNTKKDMDEFVGGQEDLCYIREKDNSIWMDDYNFGNFLIFLEPKIFFVDYQTEKLGWIITDLYLKENKTKQKKDTDRFSTYILKDGNGIYKIGKAKNVERRIKTLSIGNISITKVLEIPFDCEKELHNRFFEKRVAGEWFRLNKEDIIKIKREYKR